MRHCGCRRPPLPQKLYGGQARIGQKATAREAIERLYKGRREMDQLCKRWAKQGIRVVFELDPEGGPMDATYTLAELPEKYVGTDIDPEQFLTRKYKVN